MALTYVLIASNTLSSSAASVTFSAIPNTYTDLVLRVSTRDTRTASGPLIGFTLRVNNDFGSNYSSTKLIGNGSTASSSRQSNYDGVSPIANTGDIGTSTADTFNNGEIYFSNYTSTGSKPISVFNISENNNATTGIQTEVWASLYRGTSAISTIVLTADGTAFKAGSSFFLYGIKNS